MANLGDTADETPFWLADCRSWPLLSKRGILILVLSWIFIFKWKKYDPLTNIEDNNDQTIAESDWMTVMSENAHQKNILIFFFPSC